MPDIESEPKVVEAPALVVPAITEPGPLDTAHNIASKTTAEQDKKSQGQRNINIIWEGTQSVIALSVVMTTCIGIFIGRVWQQMKGTEIVSQTIPFPPEWWTIVGLVIGFYFGRTNHSRIGDKV